MPNYTLLLIDYDPRTLDLLREPLEEMGYTVAIAKDGEEALRAVRDLNPALAFIEVMLPKRPGLEVCKEIKETASMKQTKVVAMTSRFSARRYRHKALREYRADDFIEKPIDPTTLHPLLRRLLTGPPPPVKAEAAPKKFPSSPAASPSPTPPPAPAAAAVPTPQPASTPTPAPTPVATPAPAAAAASAAPAHAAAPAATAAPPSMFSGNDAAAEKEIVDHLDAVLSEQLDDLFGD